VICVCGTLGCGRLASALYVRRTAGAQQLCLAYEKRDGIWQIKKGWLCFAETDCAYNYSGPPGRRYGNRNAVFLKLPVRSSNVA
jgi:hypothetical protein